MTQAKDNILKKIRAGKEKANLWNHISEPEDSNFFTKSDKNLIDTFKESIEKVDGEFIIVENESDLRVALKNISEHYICKDHNLQTILNNYNIDFSDTINVNDNPIGLISCEYLVARLGSVLTSSAINSGREINIFPEHQVVFAEEEQLVYDITDAIEGIKSKYTTLPSMISFATGPSRTADIEKTLILGAHGPKMLTIIYKSFE